MKEKIKTITIIVLILLVCITNVNAITSNEVTYEEGKSLTETLDGLYNELNTYKTGGSVTADKILTGYTTYSNGSLITGTIPDYTSDTGQNGLAWGVQDNVNINGYGQLTVGIRSGYYGNVNYGEWDSPAIVINGFTEKIGLTANKVAAGQTIGNINGTFTSDATASAGEILKDKTAYVNGSKITGNMANKGKQEYTNLVAGGTYTIPAGYHNGTGTVTAKTLASQTGVDSGKTAVNANTMLEGYQGWVNGTKVTGTMVNLTSSATIQHAAGNITPVILGDQAYITTNTDGVERFQIRFVGAGGFITNNTLIGVDVSKAAIAMGITTTTVKCNQTVGNVKGACTLYEIIASESLGTDRENGIKYDEKSSDNNGKGVYTATNESGLIYFYRGEVNNHVLFNNICWRVVRTTSTGGVKLIYDGTPTNNQCNNTGDATQLDSTGSAFNSDNSKPEYAGWKYTEGEYHGTSSPSTIYSAVNTWYTNNMSSVQSKLESTIWCSDRRAYSANTAIPGETGTMTYNASSTTSYAPYIRAYKLKSPSLECPNSNDQFPGYFGLITSDEVMYAGGVFGSKNTSYYLYTGKNYWTLSPSDFTSGNAYVVAVNNIGTLNVSYVTGRHGVRPMVSLASSAIVSSGNGSSGTPYIIN